MKTKIKKLFISIFALSFLGLSFTPFAFAGKGKIPTPPILEEHEDKLNKISETNCSDCRETVKSFKTFVWEIYAWIYKTGLKKQYNYEKLKETYFGEHSEETSIGSDLHIIVNAAKTLEIPKKDVAKEFIHLLDLSSRLSPEVTPIILRYIEEHPDGIGKEIKKQIYDGGENEATKAAGKGKEKLLRIFKPIDEKKFQEEVPSIVEAAVKGDQIRLLIDEDNKLPLIRQAFHFKGDFWSNWTINGEKFTPDNLLKTAQEYGAEKVVKYLTSRNIVAKQNKSLQKKSEVLKGKKATLSGGGKAPIVPQQTDYKAQFIRDSNQLFSLIVIGGSAEITSAIVKVTGYKEKIGPDKLQKVLITASIIVRETGNILSMAECDSNEEFKRWKYDQMSDEEKEKFENKYCPKGSYARKLLDRLRGGRRPN